MAGGDATIEDVAARAGVSVATVSRAVRGLPNVSPATRQRVLAVAAELDYRPHPQAARLATGRTRAIGMAVPLLNTWYHSQLLAGAEAVLQAEGYELLVYSVTGPEARRRFLAEAQPFRRRVDGLVLADLHLPEGEAEDLAALGVAIVTVGQRSPHLASVQIDDREGVRMAVRHLVELGHTRIALVGGLAENPLGFSVPEVRRGAWEDSLTEAGLPHDPGLVELGNDDVQGGVEAGRSLLSAERPPTAVFAASDEMAFGVLRAARDARLQVPDQLSVVGFDDHDLSRFFDLTTVVQSVVQQGAVAARALLDLLVGGDISHQMVPVSLVVRASTAALSP